MSNDSISDRKKKFLEDCCGGGGMATPAMSGGSDMYTSAAPAVDNRHAASIVPQFKYRPAAAAVMLATGRCVQGSSGPRAGHSSDDREGGAVHDPSCLGCRPEGDE